MKGQAGDFRIAAREWWRVREEGERNPTVEGLKQLEECRGFLVQGFCVRGGGVLAARELWALALRSSAGSGVGSSES